MDTMEVDEVHSDCASGNAFSDDDFDVNSEEENKSGSLNIGKDPNSSNDDIDPVLLAKALKHFKGVVKSYEVKYKSRHRGVEKRTSKNTRHEKVRAKGKASVDAVDQIQQIGFPKTY